MTGRKPKPSALRRAQGNPGKRGYNPDEPQPPDALPECPSHLSDEARAEWDRLAGTLHRIGVLTVVDRGALAAYCQAWGRWVEAEEKLSELPAMVRTPSGHIQQNPWLSVANKQLELMGRYMTELGITPSSRTRVASLLPKPEEEPLTVRIVYSHPDGVLVDETGKPIDEDERGPNGHRIPILDSRL